MQASSCLRIGERKSKAKCLGHIKIPDKRLTGLGTDWEGVLESEQKTRFLLSPAVFREMELQLLFTDEQNYLERIHSSIASSAF